MVRTEANEDLIAEIEGGIKKEVSVVQRGKERVLHLRGIPGVCPPPAGPELRRQAVLFTLRDPMDAYEWSFVAVPAQRGAGVVKHWGGGAPQLSDAELDRIAGQIGEKLKAVSTHPRTICPERGADRLHWRGPDYSC